jgi:hypothetical protein
VDHFSWIEDQVTHWYRFLEGSTRFESKTCLFKIFVACSVDTHTEITRIVEFEYSCVINVSFDKYFVSIKRGINYVNVSYSNGDPQANNIFRLVEEKKKNDKKGKWWRKCAKNSSWNKLNKTTSNKFIVNINFLTWSVAYLFLFLSSNVQYSR